ACGARGGGGDGRLGLDRQRRRRWYRALGWRGDLRGLFALRRAAGDEREHEGARDDGVELTVAEHRPFQAVDGAAGSVEAVVAPGVAEASSRPAGVREYQPQGGGRGRRTAGPGPGGPTG